MPPKLSARCKFENRVSHGRLAIQVRCLAARRQRPRRWLHHAESCPRWPEGCLVSAPSSDTARRRGTTRAYPPARTKSLGRSPRFVRTGKPANARSRFLRSSPESRRLRRATSKQLRISMCQSCGTSASSCPKALERRKGIGVVLVVKQPTGSDGCIENEHPARVRSGGLGA